MLPTCVHPDGRFRVGKHRPGYTVANFRARSFPEALGHLPDGTPFANTANFPEGDLNIPPGHPVYEIRNPLPFRGATYIDAAWAARPAANPDALALKPPPDCSLRSHLANSGLDEAAARACIRGLPLPLRYALAATSNDPEELCWLAEGCARFEFDDKGRPAGLLHQGGPGRARPAVDDAELFETIANNPALPDPWKTVMVLRPGAQGTSPITADEYHENGAIFEYLRANSYIPGGHYAANFAHISPRYSIEELSLADMRGLRHLHYRRIYTMLAGLFGVDASRHVERTGRADPEQLEALRLAVLAAVRERGQDGPHPAALWGWNFGYDFSASGYRLHASHQMIHQQYALVPEQVPDAGAETPLSAYACGDLVAAWLDEYRAGCGGDFFSDYLKCIANNVRADGGPGPASLVVFQDDNVLLFAPKAQVSQWELDLMVTADAEDGPVGNILEAGPAVRASLDRGLLLAQRALAGLGARMVTSIEYGKRVGLENGQRLLYSLLPKLPWAMGGFTEAQGRYVSGHYPEDFAAACRARLTEDDALKPKRHSPSRGESHT